MRATVPQFGMTPNELLQLGYDSECIVADDYGQPVCRFCPEPVAWIVWDPKTWAVKFVPETEHGAMPLNTCAAHRMRGR